MLCLVSLLQSFLSPETLYFHIMSFYLSQNIAGTQMEI